MQWAKKETSNAEQNSTTAANRVYLDAIKSRMPTVRPRKNEKKASHGPPATKWSTNKIN